jgi:hypothetical protein
MTRKTTYQSSPGPVLYDLVDSVRWRRELPGTVLLD